MRYYIVKFIPLMMLAVVATSAQAGEPGLIATCGDGPTEGTRIQYSEDNDNRAQIMQERLTLEPLTYAFDVPAAGMVHVTYGGEETIGTIVNTDDNYKTVTYVYNDVAYMDTLFLNTGIVLSSEHRDDLFGENIVIVWQIDCDIQP